jgi:hypothetical protein
VERAVKGRGLLVLSGGIMLGICCAVTIQWSMSALRYEMSRRSLVDCMVIAGALERYREDNGQYPPLDGDPDHLAAHLVPRYLAALPERDVQGEPYLVFMSGSGAAVVSTGCNGYVVEAGTVTRGMKGRNCK